MEEFLQFSAINKRKQATLNNQNWRCVQLHHHRRLSRSSFWVQQSILGLKYCYTTNWIGFGWFKPLKVFFGPWKPYNFFPLRWVFTKFTKSEGYPVVKQFTGIHIHLKSIIHEDLPTSQSGIRIILYCLGLSQLEFRSGVCGPVFIIALRSPFWTPGGHPWKSRSLSHGQFMSWY